MEILRTEGLYKTYNEGTELEVVGPDLRPFPVITGNMTDLDNNPLAEPRTPQMKFYLPLPRQVPPYTILRKAVDLSAK